MRLYEDPETCPGSGQIGTPRAVPPVLFPASPGTLRHTAPHQRIIDAMARRPAPASAASARRAVADILARRTAPGVPHPEDAEMFPDADDLLAVVRYVHAYRRVPPAVLANDLLSCLTILDHLRGELERVQAATVKAARTHRVRWVDLAPGLRVTTAQGAEQAYLRMVSALESGVRSERPARDERTHRRMLSTASRDGGSLRDVITALVNPELRLPPDLEQDAEALWESLAEAGDGELPPAIVAALRVLVRELMAEEDLSAAAAEVTESARKLLRLRTPGGADTPRGV